MKGFKVNALAQILKIYNCGGVYAFLCSVDVHFKMINQLLVGFGYKMFEGHKINFAICHYVFYP